MMRTFVTTSAFLIAATLPAVASAQPTCALPVTAYLTDADGTRLDGAVDVELRFYVDGDPLALPVECRSYSEVPVDDGWMRVTVDACGEPSGDGCGVGVVADVLEASRDSGLWVGVALGGAADELEPRIPIGAVPFALNSENAAALGGLEADAFERAGELEAHAANPDAHHAANSAGIAIEPASVDVGNTRVLDGEVDLGPDVDDTLTAAIVQTLTGGGEADSLHTHAGSHGGGGCYTVWGETDCGEGYASMYTGIAANMLHWDGGTSGASSGTLCVDDAVVSHYETGFAYIDSGEFATVGNSRERVVLTADRLACRICCP